MAKARATLLVLLAIIVAGSVAVFVMTRGPEKPRRPRADIPLVTFQPAPVPAGEIGKHPNILLIIADDMGLDADPCHPDIGAEKPAMPNLEALCAEGVTFDRVWVNPVCSPTRATMFTGQYGFRTGVTDVDDVLSPDVESIADVLTSGVPVSYANAFIGKWHMSGANPDANAPSALGVQYFAGLLGGGVRNYFRYAFDEQGVVTQQQTYATTLFTDKAIAWISQREEQDPNRPWFLWLAYNAPHMPYHLPPKDLLTDASLSGSFWDRWRNPRNYYFAALEAVDKEMGRLLASLPPPVRAETTVIFIGDNGTPGDVIQEPYTPKQAKTSVYGGGVWGVLTVSGRGVTRRGVHDDTLINGTDLFATVAELAGGNALARDSVSFAKALTSPDGSTREFLYTEWVPSRGPRSSVWAVRDDRYKLIAYADGREEFYDLQADPYEKTDLLPSGLSAEQQEALQTLRAYQASLRNAQ